MKPLADFVIALADYARVEGRRCRRSIVGLVIAASLSLVAAALILIGFLTLVYSLYTALVLTVPEPVALLLVGLAALALGGVALWIVRVQMK